MQALRIRLQPMVARDTDEPHRASTPLELLFDLCFVDDVTYRPLTFVQTVGVLILAAGVPSALAHGDFTVMTIGYVVMRIAVVTQWLRAAHDDAHGRSAARRYAGAIMLVQIGWVVRLLIPHEAGDIVFGILALAEMLVPAWAEHGGRGTAWHLQHISERDGRAAPHLRAVVVVFRTPERGRAAGVEELVVPVRLRALCRLRFGRRAGCRPRGGG